MLLLLNFSNKQKYHRVLKMYKKNYLESYNVFRYNRMFDLKQNKYCPNIKKALKINDRFNHRPYKSFTIYQIYFANRLCNILNILNDVRNEIRTNFLHCKNQINLNILNKIYRVTQFFDTFNNDDNLNRNILYVRKVLIYLTHSCTTRFVREVKQHFYIHTLVLLL